MNTEEISDPKNREKNIRAAVEEVADRLGNTAAVAKSSYIDPRIIAHYMDGKTIKNFQEKVKDLLLEMKNLSPTEACEIGRASCRESVWMSVKDVVVERE